MKKRSIKKVKADTNNVQNRSKETAKRAKRKLNTAQVKQSMRQFRESWHKSTVPAEIAELKSIKNWGARRAALKKLRQKVNEQHVLWDLHQSKTPNLGEMMNYFEKHLDPVIKVKGKDGRMHLGGKLMRQIYRHYKRTKTIDPIPKELEGITMNRALAISFLSLVESKKMPHKVGKDLRVKNGFGKKLRERKIKKIVERMYNAGKISFKGQTKINFDKENIDRIVKILGRQETATFMKSLRRNINLETGWVRWYLESAIDPTHVLNKWDIEMDREKK